MRQFVFIHTPCTGGTSISHLLYSLFFPFEIWDCRARARTQSIAIEQFLGLPIKEQQKYKAVIGHVDMSFVDRLEYPCVVFTVLREPVERVISLYKHIISNPAHHLYSSAKELGLRGLLLQEEWPEFYNGMTRRFLSKEFPIDYEDKILVHTAFMNIKYKLTYFTTYDRIEALIKWMERRMLPFASWEMRKLPKLQRLNKGVGVEVDKHTIELIKNYNRMDILLYEKIKQEIEK